MKAGDHCKYVGDGLEDAYLVPTLSKGDIVQILEDVTYGATFAKAVIAEALYTQPLYVRVVDLVPHSNTGGHSSPPQLSFLSEIDKKRTDNGECLLCGKKREMSMHGLLDCSCRPPPLARW